MIFIDPCAWQIGYKLGNILPGKWNTLDCRSTLGGVLNSHGHCDILFVGIRTSAIVCVCLSGVIVIYRWYLGHLWKYFGTTIHQVIGCPCCEWGERMSLSLGEWRASCQAHGHTFHSLVSLKMKISAGEYLNTSTFFRSESVLWCFSMASQQPPQKRANKPKKLCPPPQIIKKP